MSDFCYYLDHYPLEQHYAACEKYLYHQIDWAAKSKEIKEHGVIFFDVSDVIDLFPHLELDESYELICYLASEYHGIWGRVAAIETGLSKVPMIEPKDGWLSRLTMGIHFELPESAASPMEAIYHDGTPEGHFEAVLCRLFLSAIPYTCFEQKHWDIIMPAPPEDFGQAWNTRIDIPDWRPRAIVERSPNTILVFRRQIENGFGSSSGCDRIYLTQYSFQKELKYYHAWTDKSNCSMYHGKINNDKRYTDRRHCCVCSDSPLLIAEEKCYTAKPGQNHPND